MTDTEPTPPDASRDALPRHTTPTWEVELLISGVAVFAMLQLVGWLDDGFFALLPRFDAEWTSPLQIMHIYLKSATIILAITFASHLLLRAQWIAIVGMHSVYPDGIRWDRMRLGPIRREAEMRQYGDRDGAIDRADNRATIVFAIGVMIASGLLVFSLILMVVFAIVVLATRSAGMAIDAGRLFTVCVFAIMLPPFVAMFVDARFGARMRADGMPRRLVAAVLRTWGRVGLTGRGSNPTFSLLSSNGGERRVLIMTTAITATVVAGVLFSQAAQLRPALLGDYGGFPTFADGSRTLDAAHYDDQRDPRLDTTEPFIRSAIETGPYLRLVVPYRPRDAARASARDACADDGLRGGDRAGAQLDCLQRMHAVTVDDEPVPQLRYDVGSDARSDRPALVAMIDIRALKAGRHELRIMQSGTPGKDDKVAWRIPFWR